MPSPRLKDEKVQEMAALAEGYGKILADQAFGPEGPGLDVDLAAIEELAVQMQHALLKGMCERSTQRQAQRLPETQPCPECGSECRVKRPDQAAPGGRPPRPLQLQGGSFELKEPQGYCRQCRRSFFPSADGAAHRRARLQPGGAG